MQRIQDQPAVIDSSCWWITVTIITGHGGFYSRYNDNRYAVGIYMGIALWAKTSHAMQAGRQQSLRIWKPISWFRIPPDWHYMYVLPLYSKATCNVTIIFIAYYLCCQKFSRSTSTTKIFLQQIIIKLQHTLYLMYVHVHCRDGCV